MRPEPLDILHMMPHRNPMLLVDTVSAGPTLQSARAYKNVTFAEGCYRFADGAQTAEDLAYPLSLLVESFGQGAGLLLAERGFLAEANSTKAVVFGAFENITVLGHAYPGDCLCHEVQLDYAGPRMVMFSGQTRVADRVLVTFGCLKAFLVNREALAGEATHG